MTIQSHSDEYWMTRCFDLAARGIGHVSPNPPVGAVLVHEGNILAEGYHHFFGGPHAEVDVIENVPLENRHLIPAATLYVSLEPCCTFGKTPPCTELILTSGIKDVRIATMDPNPDVAGQGISILRKHGIEVTIGILEDHAKYLIRSFRTNILIHRPFVILKWAQSKFGISGLHGQQVWFSNPLTQTWSHRLRSEYDSILVGARTVETDNPYLTTREYPGDSPARVVYDPNGRLDGHYHVFTDDGSKVFYFSAGENKISNANLANVSAHLLHGSHSHAKQILHALYLHQIGNLIVEGGSYLHHLFIRENLWDEAWVVQTPNNLDSGIRAPNLKGRLIDKFVISTDTIIGMSNEKGLV